MHPVTHSTERYEIVVLLPNSEHIKGYIMKYQLNDAGARMVHLRRKTFINNDGYEYDLVTLNSQLLRCLWSET